MSLGGHATTSAYCLMYRRAELDDSPPDFLPPAVQREVEEDTKRLQNEARAPPADSPPAICLHGGIVDGAVLVKQFWSVVHAPPGAPPRRAHAVNAPAGQIRDWDVRRTIEAFSADVRQRVIEAEARPPSLPRAAAKRPLRLAVAAVSCAICSKATRRRACTGPFAPS